MMPTAEKNACEVIFALRTFEARLDEIMEIIGDKRSISNSEKAHLQSLLSPLKGEIRSAAKRGTVNVSRDAQNSIEQAYFAPSMQGALANFRVAANSDPIISNWQSCLYDVHFDITYFLSQLEMQYPHI